MWLMLCTRPDLAFTVSMLSKFNSARTTNHLAATTAHNVIPVPNSLPSCIYLTFQLFSILPTEVRHPHPHHAQDPPNERTLPISISLPNVSSLAETLSSMKKRYISTPRKPLVQTGPQPRKSEMEDQSRLLQQLPKQVPHQRRRRQWLLLSYSLWYRNSSRVPCT